jgi:polysaccharide biosynthesis transport protein
MANTILEWKDIKSYLRRRWKSFLLVFSLILITSIAIAFLLPPSYRSATTIIIKEQQIPENIVQSTITTYAEERLNSIKEQILSYDRLTEIIHELNLYPEIQKKFGLGEAAKKMRDSIFLEPKSANFVNPSTGRSIAATIAFILYYEGDDPRTVQKVTDVLGTLFLEEDTKIREKIANTTTGFLTSELENLKRQIQKNEKKISDFKKAHSGELPEHVTVNLSSIGRLERELERVNLEIRTLKERKINLEGQISSIDPLVPIQIDGKEMARNPSEQLKYLRLKLLSLQSVLSEKHPDIKKLNSEIRILENQTDVSIDQSDIIKRLNDLRMELSEIKGNYSEKHPKIQSLNKEIEELEASLSGISLEKKIQEEAPDNPTYINLKTQISTLTARILALEKDKEGIQEELVKYRKRVESAPMIEKEYSELTRDYEITKQKYNDLMAKLMTARLAQGMEEGQHGQRFEIKSHAYLPGKPHKPNRIAIILLGIVLAVGAGIGFSALREFFDSSIKNEKELTVLSNIPVLTTIPRVETGHEIAMKILRKLGWSITCFGIILIGAFMIDSFILPLDELWDIILKNAKAM